MIISTMLLFIISGSDIYFNLPLSNRDAKGCAFIQKKMMGEEPMAILRETMHDMLC